MLIAIALCAIACAVAAKNLEAYSYGDFESDNVILSRTSANLTRLNGNCAANRILNIGGPVLQRRDGSGVLTTPINIYLLYVGTFTQDEKDYLTNFVTHLSGHAWWNSVSQSIYNGEGVYASPLIRYIASGDIPLGLIPTEGLFYQTTEAVLTNALANLGWTEDPNGYYQVVVAEGLGFGLQNGCGFIGHYHTDIDSVIRFGVVHHADGSCTPQKHGPVRGLSTHTQGLPSGIYLSLAFTASVAEYRNGWHQADAPFLWNSVICFGCFGKKASLEDADNGAAYNVQLGPNQTPYLLSQNYDTRTGTCVGEAPANQPGRVTCPRALDATCASGEPCPKGSRCSSGSCVCNASACSVNGECVGFPAPARTCEALPDFGVVEVAVGAVVVLACDGVPTPSSITCMSNGQWSDLPVCTPSPQGSYW